MTSRTVEHNREQRRAAVLQSGGVTSSGGAKQRRAAVLQSGGVTSGGGAKHRVQQCRDSTRRIRVEHLSIWWNHVKD